MQTCLLSYKPGLASLLSQYDLRNEPDAVDNLFKRIKPMTLNFIDLHVH